MRRLLTVCVLEAENSTCIMIRVERGSRLSADEHRHHRTVVQAVDASIE
jgi:hypothetical protein